MASVWVKTRRWWLAPPVPGSGRRGWWGSAIAAVIVGIVFGCGSDSQVLPDEAFRTAVPSNAEIVSESESDGSGLIQDGERSVLRTLEPKPPNSAEDVFRDLVEAGRRYGWVFPDEARGPAIGSKQIGDRTWTVSVAVRDGTVVQLFTGR